MRKVLSCLLTAVLLLTLTAPILAAAVEYGTELNPGEKTYTQRFSDVPSNHWAFQYVAELVERGAINGYPDGKFYPDKIVTREEFAKIMVVAAGLSATPAATSSYNDVPLTYWASPFIETAKPYMTAYQNAQGLYFKPTDGALREDIAVAVVMLKGYDARLADLSIIRTMFSDVDAISTSAQPYVALAVENGIISGYVDGTFRGQNTITRSEAAAILWRAFQYGSDTKVMPGQETTVSTQPSAAPSASPKPSASPTPSATPEPSATPAPSADPTPTPEPEPAKPYVAETVAKGVTISDTNMMMTIDGDSNLIYYNEKNDQIVSLNPYTNSTETLLNVSTASYTDEDGTVYKDLTVKQVFWDDVANRLLVWGKFASVQADDGWSESDQSKMLEGTFVVDHEKFSVLWRESSYAYSAYIQCALNDGTYIVDLSIWNKESGRTDVCLTLPLGLWITPSSKYMQQGSNVYLGANRGNDNYYSFDIWKYDYGASSWTRVTSGNFFNKNIHYKQDWALACQNDVFYIWQADSIQVARPSDSAVQSKLNPSADVEVKDLRPLPTAPDNLFVTTDEQYLFYDSSANSIRVIRANPEA